MTELPPERIAELQQRAIEGNEQWDCPVCFWDEFIALLDAADALAAARQANRDLHDIIKSVDKLLASSEAELALVKERNERLSIALQDIASFVDDDSEWHDPRLCTKCIARAALAEPSTQEVRTHTKSSGGGSQPGDYWCFECGEDWPCKGMSSSPPTPAGLVPSVWSEPFEVSQS